MKIKIILFCIIILAACFRFYNLGVNPASLDWDEASLGYNAYSILKTGTDEYGVPHPLTLRSFNDYKPAGYAYAAMLPIKVFGLNEFGVRFSSAVMGFLLPLAIYFLLVAICQDKFTRGAQKLSLVAAFLTAANPWMIQFSRGAFEANLGLSMLLWGVVVFFYFRKSILGLVAGSIIILSSVYAYHANKFVAPAFFFIFFLFLLVKKKIDLRKSVILLIISFVVLLPFMRSLIIGYGFTRFNATSGNFNFLNFTREFFSHFNFNFLFLNGDGNFRHHVAGFGLFYVFESILMFFGLFNFLKFGKNKFIFFTLFFLSLVPSSIAEGAPHAIRALLSFPFFLIFVAYGLKAVTDKMFKITVLALYIYFIFFYANSLYKHYPVETSQNWQYGYKQVANYIFEKNNYQKYDKIVITNAYDEPYIYMLFYGKDRFLLNKNNGIFQNGFLKFEFKKINWDEEKNRKNVLFIGTEDELRNGKNLLDTIYFPDGKTAFKIVNNY